MSKSMFFKIAGVFIAVLLSLAIIVGTAIAYFVIPRNSMTDWLNTITPNETYPINYTVVRQKLYIGNTNVDLMRIAKQHFGEKFGNIVEVICIYSGNIYFLVDITEGITSYKVICSYSMSSFEIQELYSRECLGISDETTKPQIFADNIIEQISYYHNGCIIFNYGDIVTVYSISEQNTVDYPADDFYHQAASIQYEMDTSNSITFIMDGVEKQITVEDVMLSDMELRAFYYEFHNKHTTSKLSFFEYFFSRVQIVDGKPYIICNVFNKIGESYALFFKYDFESNECIYLNYCFSNGLADGNVCLVYDDSNK